MKEETEEYKYPPRGKSKYTTEVRIRDMYNIYEQEVIQKIEEDKLDPRLKVDYMTFKAMVIDYFEGLMDQILNHSEVVDLPYGNGKLYIKKKKMPLGLLNRDNQLKIDYAESKKFHFKKIIYHLNEHSGGYRYGFHWAKGRHVRRNNFYAFIPVRKYKRAIKPSVLSGRDYWEHDHS